MFIEAFAVVREAAKRKLGMRHFDVQVSLSLIRTRLLLLRYAVTFSGNLNSRLLAGLSFTMAPLRR